MKTPALTNIAFLVLLSCGCNNSKSDVTTTTPVSQTQPATSVAPVSTITQPATPSALPPPPCAISLNEATPQSIEANYTDAINADSTKAAFAGHTHEFVSAFRQMISDFTHYLEKNESFKKKNFGFYNRVYFQANGTIDYYFYKLQHGALNKDEEALFKKSLNEFIKTYKFPMAAKVPFAQYSPVMIDPN